MTKAIPLLLALGAVCIAPPSHAQSAAEGLKKADMCAGCHGIDGYQASFPEVYKVPKIAGQSASYIVAALNEYKKGERRHPSMRGIATSLSDGDMADLAAYYSSLGAPSLKTVSDTAAPAAADVNALITRGACASCHGANFNKPIAPGYPKLAGQYANYLYAALRAYGTEGNPYFGRSNAVMGGVIRQFKHDELKAIAQYLSTLPGDVHAYEAASFR